MTTNNPLPLPAVAPRGAVQKTMVDAKVLSGFTDVTHFELLAGEYLATLDVTGRAQVLADAAASRAFVASLPAVPPKPVVGRPISHPHVDAIRADPLFAQTLGQTSHKFCYIDPSDVVALQAWIEPRADVVPTDETALLEFALPSTWDVAVEVSFVRPIGPIQILSSNPAMQGLMMELDQASGRVMIGAPKHLNLVQVVQFNGKYFLKNGYHRVADAIAAGITELPAIVVDALSPSDAALLGSTVFNIGYVLGLLRPPLVRDFHSNATIPVKVRERRYGVMIGLDIKPLNIGI